MQYAAISFVKQEKKVEEDLLHEFHVWSMVVLEGIRNQGWQISHVWLQSFEVERFSTTNVFRVCWR